MPIAAAPCLTMNMVEINIIQLNFSTVTLNSNKNRIKNRNNDNTSLCVIEDLIENSLVDEIERWIQSQCSTLEIIEQRAHMKDSVENCMELLPRHTFRYIKL